MEEYTVSALADKIKLLVESSFDLVRIRGEISGLKQYNSGHIYFSLKDNNAIINAVCFKLNVAKLNVKLEEGMEIVATGRIAIYKERSTYQLILTNAEIAGLGAMMAILAKRKEKLAKEGLFDQANKKPLPPMPSRIAVITSPTGAVIHDIIHRISARFPLHILLYPVLVQGEKAASEITKAIKTLSDLSSEHHLKPELIIIARGGGSVEDLWPFNDEELVRAVAACPIPIVSAIGHETDITLIDYAADLRAPTPTAAAELITPILAELILQIEKYKKRLARSENCYKQKKESLKRVATRLERSPNSFFHIKQSQFSIKMQRLVHLKPSCTPHIQQLAMLEMRSTKAIAQIFASKNNSLVFDEKMLMSLDYRRALSRGYVILRKNNENGEILGNRAAIDKVNILYVETSDGGTYLTPAIRKSHKKSPYQKKLNDLFN